LEETEHAEQAEKFRIKVENSAPSQRQPAKSVVWACPILKKSGVKKVADLGCGRLRNLPVMMRHFDSITLVDTETQCRKIAGLVPTSKRVKVHPIDSFIGTRNKYDAIFMISVLHIIDKPDVRKNLIYSSSVHLKKGGFFVVDVPSGESYYRSKCTDENRFGDGWVMGEGRTRTFYKNFYASELDELVCSNGAFELFQKVWFYKHLIRIYTKE